ncbi:MAG: 30S ribosome-binding factor RbfA [Fusobacteriaceae bacterium]|jgi:ribosome-binding factor A|nr:30S ribosome-binding factor RbfA [Fusobacteriaceae bacterium]
MKRERLVSIEKEIIRIVSNLLLSEVKNPKIKGIVSVTKVNVTDDLKFADVFFSVLNTNEASDPETAEKNKKEIQIGLEEIKGFLRKKIAEGMDLRFIPEIRVKIDDSMEYASKINKLLDEIKGK